MKCDRCHKDIPDTQMYPPVQIGFQFEPRQLCRKCIDEYKQVMIPFWNMQKPKPLEGTGGTLPKRIPAEQTRETMGSPINRVSKSNIFKHNIVGRVIIPAPMREEPKPNIFMRLYDYILYKKVPIDK